MTEMTVNGQKKQLCMRFQTSCTFPIVSLLTHVQCHWVTERRVDNRTRLLSTNRCHTDSLSTQQTTSFSRFHRCQIRFPIQFGRTLQELTLPNKLSLYLRKIPYNAFRIHDFFWTCVPADVDHFQQPCKNITWMF